MPTINYDFVSQEPGQPIIIRDMCNERGGMSVTNGIEAVIEELFKCGALTPDRRLLYYDTEGELTEALHKNGVFVGYKTAFLAEGLCPDCGYDKTSPGHGNKCLGITLD